MPIEAMTFDAFGTVLDTGRAAVLDVAEEVVAEERLAVSPMSFLAAWDEAFFSLQKAGGAPGGRFLILEETSERSLGAALRQFGSASAPRRYVDGLLRRWRSARPFPDAREALRRLRGKPVAIVSNADDDFLRDLLGRCRIPVDVVITSEATRSYKPDRGIFEAALAALGTPADRTLHVGDSYAEDVVGSKRAGMAAAWLNRRGLPRPGGELSADYEVPDLRAIPALLGPHRAASGRKASPAKPAAQRNR